MSHAFCLTSIVLLSIGMVALAGGEKPADPAPANPEAAAVKPAPVYRHMVLFKFKDDATAEQIAEIVDSFGHLQNVIPTIIGYEHGTDVSPEKLAKGFTHCFLVTFETKEDLEAYLPHEAHQAFTRKLKPILADVLVVDYWAGL